MVDRNNCEEGKIILKNNEVEYSFSQVKKWAFNPSDRLCLVEDDCTMLPQIFADATGLLIAFCSFCFCLFAGLVACVFVFWSNSDDFLITFAIEVL